MSAKQIDAVDKAAVKPVKAKTNKPKKPNKPNKTKKAKRRKLEPLPRKRRRLMRLWTERVHESNGGVCAVCGKRHGEVDADTGRPCYLNAHHIEPRATCAALRYDVMNGILLCPSCHKFGRNSAHKGMVWFVTWLMEHRRAQYDHVMAHRDDVVNVNDRQYLDDVERGLRNHGNGEQVYPETNEDKEENK